MTTRLAIIYGGRSGEHDVSCASATSIMAHLDRAAYDVTQVMITQGGDWVVDGTPVGFSGALRHLAAQDVAFPALHGPYGEDGTIQSVLEFVGVPYVGNGVFASAAGMDKEFTKKLLMAEGLRVADGVILRGDATLTAADKARLGLPVFVKPARAGSSLGVSKVDEWADLPAALAVARRSDGKVLVERAVRGREIDVAVLQHPDGRVEAGPPLEIRVSAGFFDYDAKYGGTGTIFDIPASLDPDTSSVLQRRAIQAFHALECRGLLRVDFFLPDADPTGAGPILNEVNTFPGFTAASQYPRIWAAAGLEFPRLLDTLVASARARLGMPQPVGAAARGMS